MDVKVSVIMPSLNMAKYIKECMDSVLGQTLQNIEAVCVDAGSTDGTWEILQEYAKKDRRVRLIRSDKKSYGHQANLGIEAAQGEYLAFVDTDDYIKPEMYEKLVAAADETGADFAKGERYHLFLRPDGEVYCKRYHIIEPALVPRGVVCGKTLEAKDLLWLYLFDDKIWDGVYRKSFFDKFRIRLHESPGAVYQDFGFSVQTLARAEKAVYLDEPFYFYRIRPDASTANPNSGSFYAKEFAWVLESGILDGLPADRLAAVIMKMANVYYYSHIGALAANGFDYKAPPIAELDAWFDKALRPRLEAGEVMKELYYPARWGELARDMLLKRDFAEKVKHWYSFQEDDFVVFGAGKWGEDFAQHMLLRFKYPVAFADNGKAKWHTRICGAEVLPPAECVQRFPKAAYVITNRAHQAAIAVQLLELGVAKERIMLYALDAELGWKVESL